MGQQHSVEQDLRTSAEGREPRRVMVVSADMGGGHNATAGALEEAVQRLWPGSETTRVDALDVMGPGIGRLFRAIYVGNVEQTPWLYEFFYASLWRHRWFAHASKRFTGSWCGRRLGTHVDRFDPDLIVSTYPLGSSGLAWLRRHRGLAVPTGCWISDFSPHPFWVYPELDTNFVMDEVAVPVARAAEPDAIVEVCAPPVVASFRPGDRAAARRRLGLREDALVVLVSCGAYAFGDVESIVRTLTAASGRVQVVAACGRNEATRARLEDLGLTHDRLLPLGWTDEMAPVVQSADLVLTNAGGATALEALASGTALVTACPIAAHGDANAALMTVAGLTEICSSESRLEEFIRATADRADSLRPLESRIRERVAGHDLDGGLRRLAAASGPQGRPWPMRPADAFFCHVESPQARQELGVVLELEPESSGTAVGLEQVRRSIQDRTPGLNSTRRVLVRRRRPGWFLRGSVDASRHVDERRLPAESTDAQMWEAVGDFWSAPLPEDEPAWRMQLIHGQGGGRSLFAIKMHHSQGDGISALGLLDRLLDHADDDPVLERRPSGAPGAQTRPQASVLARGLWHLATRGRVTRQPLNARPLSPDRSFVAVPLPWPEVRRLAERYDVRPHELVLALVADGLDRALRPAGLTTGHEPLRAMVPVAMRAPRLDRVFGNWTGSLALDLPMGEMPLYVRAARVRAEARRRAEHGEPQAAGAVVRLAGMLPSAVHRRFTRVVYNRRFFSTIVTYMPGVRRPRWCAGAHVRAMYPVLPLAPGVPLTVGVLVSDGVAGIGVLLDRGLGLGRDAVESAVRDAFTDGGGHFVTQAVDSPAVDSPAVDSPAVDSPAADSPAAGAGQSG